MPASIRIDEGPDTWVLTARGELDYADCPTFRSHVQRVLNGMPGACIVDLSGIDYLDSSGLGLLLSLYREYGNAGGRLVLIPSETVDGILDITRLDSLFDTAADMPSALARLGG